MTVRVYIVPVELNDAQSARGPKYFQWRHDPDPPALVQGVQRATTDYGLMDYLIEVADVTTAQHNALIANSDVIALPANLDSSIGGQLAAVKAALESRHIPGEWLTSGMSYRTVLHAIGVLFMLAQRYHGLHALRLIETGITLDNTLGDLPVAARQRLNATAQSIGLDTSAITLATTLRQALRSLVQQMDSPIQLGLGVEV